MEFFIKNFKEYEDLLKWVDAVPKEDVDKLDLFIRPINETIFEEEKDEAYGIWSNQVTMLEEQNPGEEIVGYFIDPFDFALQIAFTTTDSGDKYLLENCNLDFIQNKLKEKGVK